MKILHVVHQFLPEYVGGTEIYVADLCRRLQRRGHEVAIFSGGPEPGRRVWDGVDVETVPGGLRGPRGPLATFLTTFGNRATETAFSRSLARFQPDAVHFHHLLGLSGRLIAMAHRGGTPTCYTFHDYWFMCPKSQLIDHQGRPCAGPRFGLNCSLCAAERLGVGPAPIIQATAPLFILRERRIRRAIASAGLLLSPSSFLADLATAHGLPPEKLRVVEFGLDNEPVRVPRSRERGTRLRIVYLGAIEESKGVHVLVRAAQVLSGAAVEIRVYGDLAAYPGYAGPLASEALGTPVRFMGPAPRDSVTEILAGADVLVVPSLWYENSPLVIAESFAAGVPVVASDLGALPERVDGGGLLFPPGDADALAGVLLRLVEQPGLLEELRTSLFDRTLPARSAHVDEMEAIYRELVGRA